LLEGSRRRDFVELDRRGGLQAHAVLHDRPQMTQERLEAVDGLPSSVRFVSALAFARADRWAGATTERRPAAVAAGSSSAKSRGANARRICHFHIVGQQAEEPGARTRSALR